jgi:Transposase Tn5 dimerisation domain
VSCEAVFEAHEGQTICAMQARRPPPQVPPSLREVVRRLAQLGGFLARQSDGEPGVQTLWQGYQRLHEFIYALEMHHALNAS